jgi:hypothetical protein
MTLPHMRRSLSTKRPVSCAAASHATAGLPAQRDELRTWSSPFKTAKALDLKIPDKLLALAAGSATRLTDQYYLATAIWIALQCRTRLGCDTTNFLSGVSIL